MSVIRHGHASSKHDRPPKTLSKQVGNAVESGKDANLLTFTEIDDKHRAEALKTDGWGVYAPHGTTDCAVMWDKDEFTAIIKRTDRLGDKTFKNGNGVTMKAWSTTVILDHVSGNTLWVSVSHLPSQVQAGDHFSQAQTDADRVACWKSAVNDWKNVRSEHRDKWGWDTAMHVADWNVDLHLGVWREDIDGRIANDPKNFRGTWTKDNMPNGGTHGNRLIDATWANGQFKDAFLLPDNDDASDHRPYGDVIGWN